MKKGKNKTKNMVLIALFIAMSVVGGYIKIPNPVTSSIAFDSLPAYLGTLIFGGLPGAVIGFLGHLSSAAIGGFPLGIPIHILVAVQMFIIMLIFRVIAKRVNLISAIVIGILLNGVGAPACLILIPGMGMPVFVGAVIPLTITSIFNVVVAALIYKPLNKTGVIKNSLEVSDGV
jgi:riboflavin transporter